MIKRNTWILLGIFVIVLAFAIYYQNTPKKAAVSATATPGTTALFNNVDEKSISTLRVEDTSGKAVALGRGFYRRLGGYRTEGWPYRRYPGGDGSLAAPGFTEHRCLRPHLGFRHFRPG